MRPRVFFAIWFAWVVLWLACIVALFGVTWHFVAKAW